MKSQSARVARPGLYIDGANRWEQSGSARDTTFSDAALHHALDLPIFRSEMSPENALSINQRVAIITECGGSHKMLAAVVKQQTEGELKVEVEGCPPQEVGKPIAVLAGNGVAQRLFNVCESDASAELLTLRTECRPGLGFDCRGTPRYPAFVSCELIGDGCSATGRCVDISRNGAALETGAWTERKFALVLHDGAVRVEIPCEVVAVETVLSNTVLHVRFGELPDGLVASWLGAIVAKARREFKEAQRYLAGRPDDPLVLPLAGADHAR
jgi:hypothetical protein